MEAMVTTTVEDGQQQKSPMEVVSEVLGGSSLFLHNVGLQDNSKKSSTSTVSAKFQEL
jgi:hypothetical protein